MPQIKHERKLFSGPRKRSYQGGIIIYYSSCKKLRSKRVWDLGLSIGI